MALMGHHTTVKRADFCFFQQTVRKRKHLVNCCQCDIVREILKFIQNPYFLDISMYILMDHSSKGAFQGQ